MTDKTTVELEHETGLARAGVFKHGRIHSCQDGA